uniref:Uncharacterized protein n=1 Tax=Onchocerca volvulus TaxID=6282 RepID=A0A8R1XQA3_ONCVO
MQNTGLYLQCSTIVYVSLRSTRQRELLRVNQVHPSARQELLRVNQVHPSARQELLRVNQVHPSARQELLRVNQNTAISSFYLFLPHSSHHRQLFYIDPGVNCLTNLSSSDPANIIFIRNKV